MTITTLPRWRRNVFTLGACYDLWVVGTLITTLGPLVPFLMGHFALSPATVGMIFTTRGIGYLVSVVVGGVLTDYFGRKPIVVAGALLAGISLGLTAASDSFAAVLGLALITGVGQGLIDGVANVIVTDMHPNNPGRALNFLHVWFGVGAFTGPLVAGWFLGAGNWRGVLLFAAVAALGLLIPFGPFPYPRTLSDSDGKSKAIDVAGFRRFFSSSLFLTMALLMFLYNGVAGAIIGWVNTYLVSLFDFSTMAASITLSMYSAGILVGRAFLGVFVERMGYGLALLICSVGSFLSIGLAVLVPSGVVAAVGFALTGLFFAGIFPTALAVGRNLFPTAMGSVSGALVGAAALGSMVIPSVIGPIAQVTGIRLAMGFNVILLAVLAWAGVRAYVSLRTPGHGDHPSA